MLGKDQISCASASKVNIRKTNAFEILSDYFSEILKLSEPIVWEEANTSVDKESIMQLFSQSLKNRFQSQEIDYKLYFFISVENICIYKLNLIRFIYGPLISSRLKDQHVMLDKRVYVWVGRSACVIS